MPKFSIMREELTDLAVIILVGREELHIRRCLERLAPLRPRQVFVVESQTGDRTHAAAVATAKDLNWRIEEGLKENEGRIPLSTSTSTLHLVFNPWPGNQATQFNWALDCVLKGKGEGEQRTGAPSWILRLDADEYLTEETKEKIVRLFDCSIDKDIAGFTLELKRRFCGGEIRHATNGIRLLRLFRRGVGRCEERSMDEHIVLRYGRVADFDGAFYDDNLNSMNWWREKHRGYAKREAADAIAFARGEIHFKREKELYYRMPRYFRAVLYFCIRYFLKGGFLDGYAGWMWNFWQGFWYRWIVDREIGKARERR